MKRLTLDPTLIKERPSEALANFLAGLSFCDLPEEVVSRTEEAFVDWIGCALAGRGSHPIQALERFANAMGPPNGPSQILVSRRLTSPFFAALINAASSHVAEMDDVHNGAMFHPGTTVFPAILAAAQHIGVSGQEFIVAAVTGYEAAVRAGEFLGPNHYEVFHTTGTVGTLGAAAGVARLIGLNTELMLHSLGTAGTQAAGLWEFLRDAADSKLLHSGKAASNGLLSAYLARDGFTGASCIFEGKKGLATAFSRGGVTDRAKLTEGLGERWVILECTYKPYACCRHIHPSADALLQLMRASDLKADDIAHVTAHVHQGAIDVLSDVATPTTVNQARFSIGFVLALIATYGTAGVDEFNDYTLQDPKLNAFLARVEMVLDSGIPRDARVRPGFVEITTRDGRRLTSRVAAAKGDPENSLNRQELTLKAQQLAAYKRAATREEMETLLEQALHVRNVSNLDKVKLESV